MYALRSVFCFSFVGWWRSGQRRAGRPRVVAGAGPVPRQARGEAAGSVLPQPRGQEGEAGSGDRKLEGVVDARYDTGHVAPVFVFCVLYFVFFVPKAPPWGKKNMAFPPRKNSPA